MCSLVIVKNKNPNWILAKGEFDWAKKMTTINLHQKQQDDKSNSSGKAGNSGFIFSLAILLVTLSVLAGLKFYGPFMEKKHIVLENEVTMEKGRLVGLKSLENVVDMQNRLNEIKENLKITEVGITRIEMTRILDNLSGDLDKSVVVSEFKYDADKVTVSFEANNFSDVAKQVFNFKKSDKFSEVEVLTIDRNERTIVCSVAMNIK